MFPTAERVSLCSVSMVGCEKGRGEIYRRVIVETSEKTLETQYDNCKDSGYTIAQIIDLPKVEQVKGKVSQETMSQWWPEWDGIGNSHSNFIGLTFSVLQYRYICNENYYDCVMLWILLCLCHGYRYVLVMDTVYSLVFVMDTVMSWSWILCTVQSLSWILLCLGHGYCLDFSLCHGYCCVLSWILFRVQSLSWILLCLCHRLCYVTDMDLVTVCLS